jgi:hypothetical protein
VAISQRLMFVNLWSLAGRRICKERIELDHLDMVFLEYDKAAKEFSKR